MIVKADITIGQPVEIDYADGMVITIADEGLEFKNVKGSSFTWFVPTNEVVDLLNGYLKSVRREERELVTHEGR